jgi:glycosyltransferase involved in cell wall biosynthesis
LKLKGYSKSSSYDCPVVTVIVIASNDSEKLEKTIRSVVDQTHDNVELIIIGIDSAQPISDVLKSSEDRIDYWVIEPGIGMYDAMNKGIDLASGDWINFLNAGDTLYDRITVQTILATEYGRADFIFGHTYFNNSHFAGVQKARDFNVLWKKMIFTLQSLFSKRSVLIEHKFNTKIKMSADYEMVVDCFMKGYNFFNSDTVTIAFDPGYTESNCARMVFERWKIIRRYRSDFELNQYYLRLFLRRLFQGAGKKIEISKKR